MFIQSAELAERIGQIAKAAGLQSDHLLAYEEFIAIPFFGQIILRFTLNREDFTLEDLDRYEQLLCEIAGEDFLIDFMGSVYRKAGVDYSALEQRLIRLNSEYGDERIVPSVYADRIRSDAAYLLKAAGMDPGCRVWEIQVEEDGYLLLLLGPENRKLAEITGPVRLTVAETAETPCTGLIKAAAWCRRNGVSLARPLIGN